MSWLCLITFNSQPSSAYNQSCHVMFRLVNALDSLVLALLLYILIVFRNKRRQSAFPCPPGPPSWPIIGNLLDVPKDAPWIAYSNMSKKYGMYDIL